MLRSSGDPADQKYIELKARAEQALHDVKTRVSHASDNYYYRAKKAVYRAMITSMKNRGKGLVSVRRSVWCWGCFWPVVNP
ncbi:ElaB protein [Enterobacter cloacae]|uniref:ElaB protein n=1 Tax=Enterobacter cloacae TaxID=550 RepID=A0A377LWJ6_ENTCL|nr:ElaB protein [Enterobacter cloacae]